MANDNASANNDEQNTDAANASSPEEMAEQALDSVDQVAQKLQTETGPSSFDLPAISESERAERLAEDEATGLAMLNDVSLNVKIELGRTQMYVEDVLKLNAEAIIELDKAAGDPVDIFVNDRLVARGEVLVLNDNFCVRVSEIVDKVELEKE